MTSCWGTSPCSQSLQGWLQAAQAPGQMETKPQLLQLLLLMRAAQSSPTHGHQQEQSTRHSAVVVWPFSAYFFSSASDFPL